MPSVPTMISIDPDLKEQACELFEELGLDLPTAVNVFLRKCVLRGGLPFAVELPRPSQKTLDAMAEARRICRDPSVPAYESIADLKQALEN